MKRHFPGALVTSLLLFVPLAGRAQHSHLNAGAFSVERNARLYFVNGDTFATNAGYVIGLNFTNAGPYAGYYQGVITLTSLAATPDAGGPAFGHAALGASLSARVVSVAGPAGGAFGFWDSSEGQQEADSVTFSLPAGTTTGTNAFALSQNEGEPGADPYGHIHGRRFTATLAGLYTVGFQIFDTSHNGDNGGPIHQDSAVFPLYFQAGLTIASVTVVAGDSVVRFATQTGQSYLVEAAEKLGEANAWQVVGGPLPGNNHLQEVSVPNAGVTARFFRLRLAEP